MSILIIDDEEIILRTLAAVFTKKGMDAVTESDPRRAIDEYENRPHNVVLVDVLMPGIPGARVIREIKDMNPLCNVIVMTAFSNMQHVVECIEAGAMDYITKPFTDMGLVTDIVAAAQERVKRWSHSFGIDVDGGVVGPVKRGVNGSRAERGRETGTVSSGETSHE